MEDIFEKNLKLNSIRGSWHLKTGMGFEEENLWWGECKKRIVKHEGIDLGYYKEGSEISVVPEGFIVHNFIKGTVIKIVDDFIGKSVFIKHYKASGDRVLHSIYGHVSPKLEYESLSSFDIIGKIAVKNPIPRHYHYSLVWIPENTKLLNLDWKYINSIENVEFINPLKYNYQEEI